MRELAGSVWSVSAEGQIINRSLSHPAVRLHVTPSAELAMQPADTSDCISPEIHRCTINGQGRWALLAPPGARVWVNGRPLRHMCMLRHRDVVWWPGIEALHFSTETKPVVEPFPADCGEVYCVRCKLAMAPGKPACRCPGPGCGLWHHQDDASEQPCFTYGEKCAGCNDFPTDLNGDFRWKPDGA